MNAIVVDLDDGNAAFLYEGEPPSDSAKLGLLYDAKHVLEIMIRALEDRGVVTDDEVARYEAERAEFAGFTDDQLVELSHAVMGRARLARIALEIERRKE